MLVFSFYFLRSEIKLKIPIKEWGLITVFSIIIPLFSLLFNTLINANIYLTTILGLILGGLAYLLILFKINIIDLEEIKKIFF